jgi:hypothetical protein
MPSAAAPLGPIYAVAALVETDAWLLDLLDCFARVLPHANRAVDAPPGTRVELHVSGDAGGTWHLRRLADGWGLVVNEEPAFDEGESAPKDDAAARITVPEDVAWRLFTKALPADDTALGIAIEGDPTLAAPVLTAVAIVG